MARMISEYYASRPESLPHTPARVEGGTRKQKPRSQLSRREEEEEEESEMTDVSPQDSLIGKQGKLQPKLYACVSVFHVSNLFLLTYATITFSFLNWGYFAFYPLDDNLMCQRGQFRNTNLVLTDSLIFLVYMYCIR